MKFLNRRFAASLLVLPVLFLAACGGSSSSSTPGVTVTGLSLSATSAPFLVGAGTQLTATATYSDGTTQDVTGSATYVSSAPAKATVSAAGLVTAVAAGTVRITASYSGKTAFKDLTVSAVAPTLSSIAITTSPATVNVGATLQLTVTGTYSDSSTHDVTSTSTFVSGTPAVATVTSPGGMVSGLTVGTSTITASNGGKTATKDVSVTAVVAPGANQIVFYDGYGTNVAFKDFGGAANNVTIDPTETFNGRKVINFQVTSTGSYSGGAWYTTAPRDLSAYNAVTFYAKASIDNILNVVGFGNDGGANSGTAFPTERNALPITTSWQKFTVPVPAPAKFLNVGGLFHLADAPDGYTLYLADVVYEQLSSGLVLGGASINLNNVAPALGIGDHANVDPAQSQVSYTVAGDPEGTISIKPVANSFFDFTSSTPAVASVTPAGLITALSGGTTSVTATLGGVAASGSYPITVSSLPVPTTLPPLPAPPTGSNVLSLYASRAGGFTGSTVTDKSGNVDTWLTCWSQSNNPTAGGNPFAVTVGPDTANPRKYVLGSGGASYAGVDFLGFTAGGTSCDNPPTVTGAHTIDISAMTHFHIDVWTPNANNVQVKLSNADPATWAELSYANATLNGLSGAGYPAFGTGTWLSYDIPLSIGVAAFQNGSFGAPSTLTHLGQMVFTVPNGGIIYVDNMYFYGGGSGGGGGSAPTTVPTAPTAAAGNVISLFSSTYSGGTAGGDYSAKVGSYDASCFGGAPGSSTVTDFTIPGTSHVVKQYTVSANSFLSIETIGASGGATPNGDSAVCNGGTQSGANLIDISTMTGLHLDVWSSKAALTFNGNVYTAPTLPFNTGAGAVSAPIPNKTFAAGTWVPIDIPFGDLSQITKMSLLQLFSGEGGTIYLDNIYFYKGSSGGGGGGGATAPTTTLTPDVAVHPVANVISIYNSSGTYTNQPVVDWFPNWGQATTFTDAVIAGKTVKKYSGMNYQGWDFAGTPVDASTFTHLHIDVWTPDATKFGVAVINFVSTPTEFIVPFNASTTPPITKGSWISLDIPLTAFTGMTFGAISQIKWVDNAQAGPGADEFGTFFIDNVYFWK